MRHVGEVSFYNKAKSYGFINELQTHGTSQFFHLDNVIDRIILEVGDIVSFEIAPSKSKPGKTQAVEVRLNKRDDEAPNTSAAAATEGGLS